MKNHLKKIVASVASFILSKVVVVLFFITLIIYGVIYYENSMVLRAKISTLGDASIIAKQYNLSVDDLEETAKIVSALPEVLSKDQVQCNSILERIYKGDSKYTIVLVADKNGNSYCSSSKTTGISIADRASFQKAVRTEQLAFGGFIIEKVTGLPSASYGYPFYDANHELLGVVGIGLNLDLIEKFAENLSSTKNNQVSIVDANNNILSEYPKGMSGSVGAKGNSDAFNLSFSNIGKAVKQKSNDGFSKIEAFEATSDGSAIIVVSSQVKSTFLFSRDLFKKLFSIILLVYFVVIVVAVLLKFRYKFRIKKR